jgi:hypothetical protein
MIDGFRLKVPAKELKDHLTGKAQRFRAKANGIVQLGDATKEELLKKVQGLEYAAFHLHDDDYSLTWQECHELALIRGPGDE